VEKLLING